MAAINDLRMALQNMCQSKEEDVPLNTDRAKKQIKRSKDNAARYARSNNGNHAEPAKRIIAILNDAEEMMQHAPALDAYIKYVANECLDVLNDKATLKQTSNQTESSDQP